MKTLIAGLIACLAFNLAPMDALAQQKNDVTVTLKGQVVCSQCYFDSKPNVAPYGSPDDIKCAARCAESGIPSGLAVAGETGTALYVLEKKKSNTDWVDYLGKQVEIIGTMRQKNQHRYLKVQTIKIVDSENASSQVAKDKSNDEETLPVEAPDMVLKDLSGIEQKLSSTRGKIVVLNFWATWCVPCKKEMPDLASIQNQYAAWGLQVIGASADELAAQPRVVKFIREQKINFPIWLGATADNMNSFGLGKELPGTVIIDREGRVVARIRGVVKEEELKRHLDLLLQKQASALKEALKHPTVNARSANVPA